MATRSPLRWLLTLMNSHSSWEHWVTRTNASIPAAVIRPSRPTSGPSGGRSVVILYRHNGIHHTKILTGAKTSTVEQLILDGFEWLYQLAEAGLARTSLYIDHSAVRSELLGVADSFPNVRLADAPTGCLQQMLRDAGSAQSSPVSPRTPAMVGQCTRAARKKPQPALAVGTDASKRYAHDGVGISSVDADGRVHTAWLPGIANINLGEVLAIELAVKSHPGQRLAIATDSQAAVSYLRMTQEELYGQVEARFIYRIVALQRELELTRSRVEWVLGHSGHQLNEAADRAAVAARRNAQFEVPCDVAAAMYARIGEDVRAERSLLLSA
ncbi:RNase H family protein [Prescottella equi]